MKLSCSVLTVALLVTWVGIPNAMSIGANVGLSVLQPKEGGENLVNFSAPGGSSFVGLSFLPGLRLGTSNDNGNDFYVDLGVSSTSLSGSSVTSLQASANYQRSFSPAAATSPYLNAGIGALVLGGDSETWRNVVVGGGIGVRGMVSQGYGMFRGEVRIDYIAEDFQGFVGGVEYGVKFGFDLLVK